MAGRDRWYPLTIGHKLMVHSQGVLLLIVDMEWRQLFEHQIHYYGGLPEISAAITRGGIHRLAHRTTLHCLLYLLLHTLPLVSNMQHLGRHCHLPLISQDFLVT